MNGLLMIFRTLWYHRRTNVGVMLGVALATAVISGSLLIGDSMRYTLRRTAMLRLGATDFAIAPGDRFFTNDLAQRLNSQRQKREDVEDTEGKVGGVASVIVGQGAVTTPNGRARANQVQVVGVDAGMGKFFEGMVVPEPGQAYVNDALARQLGLEVTGHGDGAMAEGLVVRLPRPVSVPGDAALSNHRDAVLAMNVRAMGLVTPEQGGRFSLRAEQSEPMNLFVNRDWLAKQMDVAGRSNVILGRGDAPSDSNDSLHETNGLVGSDALPITLADAELSLDVMEHGGVALRSRRVFIDAPIVSALDDLPGQRVMTYFVNTIAHDDRQTPYSIVSAMDGLEVADDEIVINDWLADDLGVGVGDVLTLTYYLPNSGDALVEASVELTVARVEPIAGMYADRTLTPDFPGLAGAERMADWDGGPAIDRSRIRPTDEKYWEQYRATPRAFIPLATGQKIWANRFGTATSIRFEKSVTDEEVLARIDPAWLGIEVRPVRRQALQASQGTVDFGQLFLSLSFFLIVAAMVLTTTLFVFGVEQRAKTLGTLLALGWTKGQVRRLVWVEGMLTAIVGVGLGVVLGVVYTKVVLSLLSNGVTGWGGAIGVGNSEAMGEIVLFHASWVGLWVGPMVGFVVSVLAMWLTMRKVMRHTARALLAGAVGRVSGTARIGTMPAAVLGVVLVVIALGLGWANRWATGPEAALVFFGSGALLLVGLLTWVYAIFTGRGMGEVGKVEGVGNVWVGGRSSKKLVAMSSLGLVRSNLARRRGRSLAAIVTLSSGVFLVVAVAGFELGVPSDVSGRNTGTGGFALIAESTLPIPYDINTRVGRDHFGLDDDEIPAGSVVPIRVGAGDDASCLNLNQTVTPRLLGVDAQLLADRQAFSFAGQMDVVGGRALTESESAWSLLQVSPSHLDRMDSVGRLDSVDHLDAAAHSTKATGDVLIVPAIADANTAQWALKIKLGDMIDMVDERGQPFRVQLVATLANSIFQGSLIIDEKYFTMLYPSASGFSMLLISPPTPPTPPTSPTHTTFPPASLRAFNSMSPHTHPASLVVSSESVSTLGDRSDDAIRDTQALLTEIMADQGVSVTLTRDRLASFNRVQNTYLRIFQALGGLGVALGCVGLGIVVARNLLERRGELALLTAVGFDRRQIWMSVFVEHAVLLMIGLGVGGVAAMVAIWPTWQNSSIEMGPIGLTIGLSALVGIVSIVIALRVAGAGRLVDALRAE